MSATLAPFDAQKMNGTRLLWFDPEALERTEPGEWTGQAFLDRFSYGIQATPCFGAAEFDPSDTRTFLAERYGGFGLAQHGGGARVGNIGPFQVKGIGRNCLAGPSKGTLNDEFHAFGGFSLVEAICELINSEVYGRILPLGTAKCFGLIMSGERTAFYPQRMDAEPSPGALLVREVCVRPAHFFRNHDFQITPTLLLSLGNDVARVRAMARTLERELGGPKGFAGYLAKYLMRSANQFAFARLWRIDHGSLSPSNMAIDGRWLDLMGTSFMEPFMNYTANPGLAPFTTEPGLIKVIADELAETYVKYNLTDIEMAPFFAYYDRQFSVYVHRYLPTFFGLDVRAEGDPSTAGHVRLLAHEVLRTLLGSLELTHNLPKDFVPERDPAIALADRLFAALEGEAPGDRVADAFRSLEAEEFEARKDPGQSRLAFRGAMLVRCLKRLFFSSCFYRGRLMGESSALVLGGNWDGIGRAIDDWIGRARWIFEPGDSGGLTIVSSGGFRLAWRPDGTLLLDDAGEERVLAGSGGLREAAEIVRNQPAERLSLPPHNGYPPVKAYDFRPGVLHILRGLERLHASDSK